MDSVAILEAFALDHYEEGGHWVYETHDRKDYEKVLDRHGGDVEAAKVELRDHWFLIQEYAEDIRNA